MSKKISINCLQIICLLLICYFFLGGKAYALSPNDTTSINYFDISNNFRIDVSSFLGYGLEKFDVFKTAEDEIVKLSPGGGFGGKFSFGYCLSSPLNVNIELGTQSSTLSEDLKNVDGIFSRMFFLGTLRYKIPITEKRSINIGGGAGYFISGKLDIDASEIEDGRHNIYEYKNTIGIHFISEFEHFLPNFSFLNARWSWALCLKYYKVAYKLDSVTSDGVSIPITNLPTDIKDEVEKLNGSGIDVFFSTIIYV